MTGWTTVTAELAWGRNDIPFGPTTPFGAYFLDLTGFHDAAPYGGVTQTISTTANQLYFLSFSLGTDESDSRYRGPVTVNASVGTTNQNFTFTAPVGSTGNQWGTFTLPFTATSASTVITFQGTQSTGASISAWTTSPSPCPSLPPGRCWAWAAPSALWWASCDAGGCALENTPLPQRPGVLEQQPHAGEQRRRCPQISCSLKRLAGARSPCAFAI